MRIGAQLSPQSAHGFFERGVVQRMNSPQPDFASTSELKRAYFVGAPGGGAIDFAAKGQHETVLQSRAICGNAPTGGDARTGLELVLAGNHPERDGWSEPELGRRRPRSGSRPASAGARTRRSPRTATTSRPAGSSKPQAEPAGGRPAGDLHGRLWQCGGCLGSYELPGSAYPTLATPGRAYGEGNSFFDPDAFQVIRALLYSGDHYLQQEARRVIERSGAAILPSGQIPHHFDGAQPTYVAISGATQTGPNIFWISSALDYAAATGDTAWLRAQMPRIERALAVHHGPLRPAAQADLGARSALDRRVHPRELHRRTPTRSWSGCCGGSRTPRSCWATASSPRAGATSPATSPPGMNQRAVERRQLRHAAQPRRVDARPRRLRRQRARRGVRRRAAGSRAGDPRARRRGAVHARARHLGVGEVLRAG